LGVMRYVPVAGPAYVERYLSDGFTAEAAVAAPSLAWNRDDALQDMLVRKASAALLPDLSITCPLPRGLARLGRVGMGHVPRAASNMELANGSFVRIADVHLDVPLHWQCWRLDSPMVPAQAFQIRTVGSRSPRRRETSGRRGWRRLA
jgi:LysR family transcriptional regulator, chromosome initiation inhibitor